MENTKWLIWSIEHDAWWKPDHNGYTVHRKRAGKYSYEEAIKIVHSANLYRNDNASPNEAMVLAE